VPSNTTIEQRLARALYSDEFIYEWEFDDGCTVECVVGYEPECLGHGAHPDYDAECSLVDAFIGDTRVFSLLSHDQIVRIEALALDKHGADMHEAINDRRVERYLDRLAEEAC
jgi:hypothetical protein